MANGDPADGELVKRIIESGDREAATALFRRYLDAVYAFAHFRVGSRHGAAEEVTQETFLDAWRNLRRFDRSRALWPWLCGIAKRKLARHFRSARASVRVPESLASQEPPPDAGVEANELRTTVGRALTALAPRHRELLTGKYVDSKSLREIGGELGLSEAAVSSGLQRARQALRDALRWHGELSHGG